MGFGGPAGYESRMGASAVPIAVAVREPGPP